MLPIGEILQDTYRLERVIGRGGMGVVFEASHLRLERRFAVKVLVPDAASDGAALKRFQREALVTSRLGHPHIVEVTDFNSTPAGVPYLVMERLEGENLAQRLARCGRLGLEETGTIVRQTSSALEAAHQQGIVHRDLKPENIFLCRRGEVEDYVKLLDFGISKVLNAQTVASGRVPVGSPSYMAPEQATEQDQEIGVWTDIYALAALTFHMLAGSPPFQASTNLALLYKISEEPPPALRGARPDLSVGLERLLSRSLAKRPPERPSSIAEFWEAFATELSASGAPTEPLPVLRESSALTPSSSAVTETSIPALLSEPTAVEADPVSPTPTWAQAARSMPRRWLVLGGGIVVASLAAVTLLVARRGPEQASPQRSTGARARARAADAGHRGNEQRFRGRVLHEPRASDTRLAAAAVRPDPSPASMAAEANHGAQVEPVPVLPGAPSRKTARPRPRFRQGEAVLDVGADPSLGAVDIEVDGRRSGQSPKRLTNLAAGTHTIKWIRRVDGRVWVKKVKLKAGQVRTVFVRP